ncbi:hypothetical protein N9D84_02925 [Planktomarina temperata]|nr:hypothetical protein [Planktomarina temperata]
MTKYIFLLALTFLSACGGEDSSSNNNSGLANLGIAAPNNVAAVP